MRWSDFQYKNVPVRHRNYATQTAVSQQDLPRLKTKELIIDFREKQVAQSPMNINGEMVERVASFKFLGTHISVDLTWTANTTSLAKKAHQRL